jgi:hypothetical protein
VANKIAAGRAAFAGPAQLLAAISGQRSAIASPGTFIVVIIIAMLLACAVILWRQQNVFQLDKGAASVQALTVSFPELASIGLRLSCAVVGGKASSRWRLVSLSGHDQAGPPRHRHGLPLAGRARCHHASAPPMPLPAISQARTRITTRY